MPSYALPALFVLISAALLYVSRSALARPSSHGFYRFFAWECMLALILMNVPVWQRDAWAPRQLFSWLLLVLSAWLPIHAVRLLRRVGKPASEVRPDAALFGFEKTSALVTDGAFGFIRHPMYTALMLLTWAAFLKQPSSWPGIVLALAATGLLYMTARRDEEECLAHFGDEYRAYMQRTRRFVPFVF
jgi:protein-S-isoprenylcysteine O-methyltransferase Ste14